MATMEVVKRRTLVNPGRRRRNKMSLLQKLHFGSKRQRAAIARRLGNKGRRKSSSKAAIRARWEAFRRTPKPRLRRKRNVSNVVVAYPKYLASNPGRLRRRKGFTTIIKSRKTGKTRIIGSSVKVQRG